MNVKIEAFKADGELVIATITDESGYLSITGAVYDRRRNRGEQPVQRNGKLYWPYSMGQIQSTMREAFDDRPAFLRLLRWHLCENGIPMHYVANAVYWAEFIHGVSPHSFPPSRESAENSFKVTVVFGAVAGDTVPEPTLISRRDVAECVTAWCHRRADELQRAYHRDIAAFLEECETR